MLKELIDAVEKISVLVAHYKGGARVRIKKEGDSGDQIGEIYHVEKGTLI